MLIIEFLRKSNIDFNLSEEVSPDILNRIGSSLYKGSDLNDPTTFLYRNGLKDLKGKYGKDKYAKAIKKNKPK